MTTDDHADDSSGDKTAGLRNRFFQQWQEQREDALRKLEERARIYAEGKVPYDKDIAHEAVRQFLETLEDGGEFHRRLQAFMRKQKDVN